MKKCHVCFYECEDNVELCPACGAELIAQEQEIIEETASEIKEPVLAVEVEDVITAEVYRDMLKENGIAFTCDSAEDDGSMKVLFGGGFLTEDIYVDASDLEEAKRLYEEALKLLENEDFEYDFEEEFNGDGEIAEEDIPEE